MFAPIGMSLPVCITYEHIHVKRFTCTSKAPTTYELVSYGRMHAFDAHDVPVKRFTCTCTCTCTYHVSLIYVCRILQTVKRFTYSSTWPHVHVLDYPGSTHWLLLPQTFLR